MLSTPSLRFPKILVWIGILLMIPGLNLSLQAQQGSKKFRTNARSFEHISRNNEAASLNSNCSNSVFRSIDGTCNNTSQDNRQEWGATDIALHRSMASAYASTDPNNDMGGENRISARAISNRIVAQSDDTPSAQNLSAFVYSWGQFLDHDIDLTPEAHTEYEPVSLPPNEPLFTSEIPFFRSDIFPGTGSSNPRQQYNLITAWVDASNVYGSEESRANWLRTFSQGKLKMSAGNLLPYNTVDGEKNSALDPNAPSMAGDDGGQTVVFVAGDVRAGEQPTLTALHTLFLREHNRICEELLQSGYQDDEFIYQVARKRVGAYIQNITFQYFLPALGVYLSPYTGYRPAVQPDISNLFATAAYRLGHTMVTSEIWLRNNDCQEVGDGEITLADAFFNPALIETYNIDPIIKGLSMQVQQEVDVKIVDELRNFLFPVPGSPVLFGLDLASLNIQRGRDHGLPDYNTIRKKYLGAPAFGFNDITNDQQVRNALNQAYQGDLNNIDAWVGLLSERPIPGGSVGATLGAILREQFQKLRDGDFFYYENDPFYSEPEKRQIREVRLEEIIRRNTSINNLPENVFFAGDCRRGNDRPRPNGGGGPRNTQGDQANDREAAASQTNELQQVQLYPNPVVDHLQINFSGSENIQSVEVLSITGQQLQVQQFGAQAWPGSLNLDVSSLPKGTYLIRLRGKHQSFVEKWIKQ